MRNEIRGALCLAAAAIGLVCVAPAGAQTATDAVLNVVGGIPGTVVDVCAGPTGGVLAPVATSLQFGDVETIGLAAGTYDIAAVPAGSPCTTAPIAGLSATGVSLAAGTNTSVIATVDSGGADTFVIGVNPTAPGSPNLVVYNASADAGTPDVLAGPFTVLPNGVVRAQFGTVITALAFGAQGTATLTPGNYLVKLGGAGAPALAGPGAPVQADLRRGGMIVYAIGSTAGGTFTIVTQKLAAPRGGLAAAAAAALVAAGTRGL